MKEQGGDGYGCFGVMGVTILALYGGHVVVGMCSSPSGCILLGSHSFLAFVISRYVSINKKITTTRKEYISNLTSYYFYILPPTFNLKWQQSYVQSITLFKVITMFCCTHNIFQNIPHIHSECEEYYDELTIFYRIFLAFTLNVKILCKTLSDVQNIVMGLNNVMSIFKRGLT